MNCSRHALVPALVVLTACGDAAPAGMTRETLPDGRVRVVYAAGLPVREDTVIGEVRIGRLDGSDEESFGDIRGMEVDADGQIYLLDYQASEIRVFGADGGYLRTITTRGEGPGEISRANGIAFDQEGRLWVNDHGKRALLLLDRGGKELARHPAIVPGFHYLWSAVIDTAGTIWESWNHSVQREANDPQGTGVIEGENREYFKSFSPASGGYDSIPIGTMSYRVFRAVHANGSWGSSIPFAPEFSVSIDRYRRPWVAATGEYLLTRIGEYGDTTLELRVTTAPIPVTSEDIAVWRDGNKNIAARVPGAIDAVEKLIPEVKPLLTSVHTDELSRLWVGRTTPTGESPLFDVFSPDAEYLGSVRLVPGAALGHQPLVRGDRILMLVVGEQGDQAVVVGRLPGTLRR
ncbi:MAG: 6-bladed beta-propeller [Gemmatimonadales bacterium]|nr:6-bladed beta-propeller [Gemmatimonadales bacterium]